MARQQENELKYELDEESYHHLLGLLPQVNGVSDFSNAYFQVASETGRRDWVLRLRCFGEQPGGELTLKIGRQLSPGTFRSTEYSVAVLSAEPESWEGTEPLLVFREEISSESLQLQGAARNQRRLVKAPLGPVENWEVDRTVLPDGTLCHELEIEYPPDANPSAEELEGFRMQVEEWLFEQDIAPRASTRTKYRRFLESLGLR